jgi:hypothetical protein
MAPRSCVTLIYGHDFINVLSSKSTHVQSRAWSLSIAPLLFSGAYRFEADLYT